MGIFKKNNIEMKIDSNNKVIAAKIDGKNVPVTAEMQTEYETWWNELETSIDKLESSIELVLKTGFSRMNEAFESVDKLLQEIGL